MSEHQFYDHELIARVDAFLNASGMSPTKFGLEAVKDKRLVPDLKEGRELRSGTRQRVLSFIAEQNQPTHGPGVSA